MTSGVAMTLIERLHEQDEYYKRRQSNETAAICLEAADALEAAHQALGEHPDSDIDIGQRICEIRDEGRAHFHDLTRYLQRAERAEKALEAENRDQLAAAWIIKWMVAEKFKKPDAPVWLEKARRHVDDNDKALEEAQRDAERYRLLIERVAIGKLSRKGEMWTIVVYLKDGPGVLTLHDAIDAAIKGEA